MTGSGIAITVNEKPRTVACGASVRSLVAEMGLAGRKGVAVAINGIVAPRARWEERPLESGDRVIVIQATQGG